MNTTDIPKFTAPLDIHILQYIILYYSIGNQSYHPVVDHDFNDLV